MEFVCKDKDAVVRAANVRATLDAFKLNAGLAEQLIRKHSLQVEELTTDRFIKVQSWLDAMREIKERAGGFLVRQVGAAIVQNADFPPQFSSADAVLEALDAIYYLNHKGDVGHYATNRNAAGALVVRCETPYPRDFERGLIEGICANERVTHGAKYMVDYEEGPTQGEVTCTLTVRRRGKAA